MQEEKNDKTSRRLEMDVDDGTWSRVEGCGIKPGYQFTNKIRVGGGRVNDNSFPEAAIQQQQQQQQRSQGSLSSTMESQPPQQQQQQQQQPQQSPSGTLTSSASTMPTTRKVSDVYSIQDHAKKQEYFDDKMSEREGEQQRKTSIKSCHDAIVEVGSFSRYHYYMCFVLQYSAIVGAGIFALNTFNQTWDRRRCFDADFEEGPENQSHFDGVCQQSRCKNRSEISNTFQSIAEEWNLVCEHNTYMQIIVALLAIGRSLGFIIGGHITDYFGRKKALYVSQFGVCIISTLSIGARHWIAYGVCLFLTGLMWGMGQISGFVLTMEYTDWSHRWIINASNQKWIQYVIVAFIGYMTGDWRRYLIIINCIFAPLLIFFLLFKESPRFLIYHQRLESAAHILSDIGSDPWNHRNSDLRAKDLENIPNNRRIDPKYPSPLELFRGWERIKISLALMLAVLTASGVSNFFIQNAHPDAGNLFLNIAVYGLICSWVPILIIFLDYKYKSIARRPIYLITTLAITLCTLIVAILEVTGNDQGSKRRVFALAGASISEALFMCIMQSIVEIYPTAIRGIAVGWIMSVYGIGSTAATLFRYLGTHNWHVWPPLPYIIMPILAALTGVAGYFWVPETKHKPMEDGLNYSDHRLIVTSQNSHRQHKRPSKWDSKFHF